MENEVIDLANSSRSSDGLGSLTCDDALTRAARGHSQDMCDRGYFSHTSPEGSEPWDRAEAAGAQFSYAGENIAWGYESPQSVHTGWMNSPGHRRNLLNSGYARIGVGHVACSGKNYWTQVFSD